VPPPRTHRTRPPRLGKTHTTRFPTPPTAVLVLGKITKTISRLRASEDSDDTHATYRVAGFQTFFTGRI
jgi:hypothetical protein